MQRRITFRVAPQGAFLCSAVKQGQTKRYNSLFKQSGRFCWAKPSLNKLNYSIYINIILINSMYIGTYTPIREGF